MEDENNLRKYCITAQGDSFTADIKVLYKGKRVEAVTEIQVLHPDKGGCEATAEMIADGFEYKEKTGKNVIFDMYKEKRMPTEFISIEGATRQELDNFAEKLRALNEENFLVTNQKVRVFHVGGSSGNIKVKMFSAKGKLEILKQKLSIFWKKTKERFS